MNSEVKLPFSKNGTCNIVRRGNVVTISAIATVEVGEGFSLSNKVHLPCWAFPSKVLMTDGILKSVVAEDMNGYAKTQIVINANIKAISLFTYNTSDLNRITIHNNITYVVD